MTDEEGLKGTCILQEEIDFFLLVKTCLLVLIWGLNYDGPEEDSFGYSPFAKNKNKNKTYQ